MIVRNRKKLMFVLGTRPEVIKLAPVIREARKRDTLFETKVVTSGQHREMLDQMLEAFELRVDLDLAIMRKDQNLSQLTSTAIAGLYSAVSEMAPDCVVVQGDTTTTLIGALAACYHRVPVAHIEAGLRTFDKGQPFPEEINRRLTSQIADFHFAPTERARQNLLREGIHSGQIWVTGNTGIDALHATLQKFPEAPRDGNPATVLLTVHRRDNHGEPLERICRAILILAEKHPHVRFVCPVHLSPRVRATVYRYLRGHPQIQLTEPLDYVAFVNAMNGARVILTDSGGVQEEAPSLGKPVLVLRDSTERPEGVEAGLLRIVGTETAAIVEATSQLLEEAPPDSRNARHNPYGDGWASQRILDVLAHGNCRPLQGCNPSAETCGVSS